MANEEDAIPGNGVGSPLVTVAVSTYRPASRGGIAGVSVAEEGSPPVQTAPPPAATVVAGA